LAAFSENTHNILPKHIKAAIEDSEFAAPSNGLPLKQIGLSVALLGLGITLGAGWQHLANLPLIAGAAAPTVQTAPAPAVQPPIQEALAPYPVPAEPAPALAADAEPIPQQSSPAEDLPTPVPAPTPVQTPLQQRLAATQSWLANEDGAHFTVQLMLLTDTGAEPRPESVLSKLDREFGLAQIYVYPTSITADHQFGITFGSFSSREQALTVLAGLPTGYRSNRPVLRTVKGIRDEIAKQK